MKRRAIALALLGVACNAAAHSSATARWGVLAPLADPALLIALIAAALWSGQQQRLRLAAGAFAAALAVGLLLAAFTGPSRTQDALLGATAAMAVLVTIGRRWPGWFVVLLLGAVGIALGRGVELGAATGTTRIVSAATAGALVAVAVALGAWLVTLAKPAWARIGVRVAASWIGASALLVLALAFAP